MNLASKPTLLIVDDDASSLRSLEDLLTQEGYRVLTAGSGAEALRLLDETRPDLVLTDLRMREIDGMRVLEAMRNKYKEIPVILMTAFTSMETAIEAIQQGAYDYLSKPFKIDHLRRLVSRALEQVRLRKENQMLRTLVLEHQNQPDEVIGRSPEMVEIYKLVARAAPLPTTILIEGESGTGKEVIARLIHKNSGRTGPFLAVNCGALSENLLESELFGHVKGAFTGAVQNKTGILEAAQGGTCFLDEISNTSMALQMKLLRVLEEREITRVGSTDSRQIDARIVAASNQSLGALVKTNHFREDLFYRLKVVTIQMPPLRDRRADIPLLLDYFVRKFAQAAGKEIAIHESVYPVLNLCPWQGNVRELAHAVERAVALNSSGILTPQDFAEQCRAESENSGEPPASKESLSTLAQKEQEYILEVLQHTQQNVSQAAEILKIDRRTIYRILKRIETKH